MGDSVFRYGRSFEASLIRLMEKLHQRFPDERDCAGVLFRDVSLLFSTREAETQDMLVFDGGRGMLLPCGVALDTIAHRQAGGGFSAMSLLMCANGQLLHVLERFDVGGRAVDREVELTTVSGALQVHGLHALIGGVSAHALRLARAGRGALVMDWMEVLAAASANSAAAAA